MGLRATGPRGRESRACGLNSEGSSKVAKARARWDSAAARGPGSGECGTAKPRTQRNQEGRRGGGSPAAGRRPQEDSEGRPSPEGGRPARQRSGVGGTLTNFLCLPPSPPVGGSSSGLRPFFLSRVPRPGPRPPPDGSMSWLALASDPLVYAARARLPRASNHRHHRRRRRPAAFLAGRRAPPH